MRKIARAVFVAVASVASVAATPFAADAEPMMLTNSQMEAVTAAALIEVNINLTTQVANAIALAFATCGVCTDGAPAASSSASAGNFAASAQNQQ
jgi:hypothetical protein